MATHTLTGHLGNNRVSFDTYGTNTTRKVGEESYYPFGLNVHRLVNASNKYLYNGKELQEEINMYDYGARFYDPVIGRWTTVDALADEPEQIDKSPYAYAWNNPVNLTDPDGNCPSCPGFGYSNPMYVVTEGFRQYFQAAGKQVDKAFVSVSETVSTVISKFSVGSATTSISSDATNTTTARTNFGGFLKNNGKNTPSEPLVSITNTTKSELVQKVEIKGTIEGVDVKSVNKMSTSTNGTTTKSFEITAGKGSNGAFVSHSSNSNGGSQTDVGLKASYTTPAVQNTTTTFSFKFGATVDKQKDKR